MNERKIPLYRDPIFDGAADPTVIWNRQENCWYMFYTQRRASVLPDVPGEGYCHGSAIGIAASRDAGGHAWYYRGTAQGLEIENGHNTFWAPEVIEQDGLYHMFVTFVQGIPTDWSGDRYIRHYTSRDLWNWTFADTLPLSSNRCIDACVHRLPGGKWGLWYKDEAAGSFTWRVISEDLYHWHDPAPVIAEGITDRRHEGPNVFYWQDRYWLIGNCWSGQLVFSSPDGENWVEHPTLFQASGSHPTNRGNCAHADVVVCGEAAYIFYFCHLDGGRHTTVHIGRLTFDGKNLHCDRDEIFEYNLTAP